MKKLLENFVTQLEFDHERKILFRGRPVHEFSSPTNDRDVLLLALAECVYKYLYTHPDGDVGEAFEATSEDPELVAAFAKIGNTPLSTQKGWVVSSVLTDGSVIASRFARTQKFLPGQFIAPYDCIPIKQGTELTVTPRIVSRTQQAGFYFVFSHCRLDLSELQPMVRLYWNVRCDAVVDLLRLVVDALNAYGVTFNFKAATRSSEYSRRDCAVLYLPRRMYRIAMLVLAPLVPQLLSFLGDDIPLFTRHLAPGIGMAEDPNIPHDSFGSSRCKIVAEAVLAACEGNRVALDRFHASFSETLHSRGLVSDALYLNPRSKDVYDVSDIWFYPQQ